MSWGITIRIVCGLDRDIRQLEELIAKNKTEFETLIARCLSPCGFVTCHVEVGNNRIDGDLDIFLEAKDWTPDQETLAKMVEIAKGVLKPFILGILAVSEEQRQRLAMVTPL